MAAMAAVEANKVKPACTWHAFDVNHMSRTEAEHEKTNVLHARSTVVENGRAGTGATPRDHFRAQRDREGPGNDAWLLEALKLQGTHTVTWMRTSDEQFELELVRVIVEDSITQVQGRRYAAAGSTL